jgi:hypothetical protein
MPSYRMAKGHGGVAPTADQITIDSVLDAVDNHIDFTGTSGAGSVMFTFSMPDLDSANKVAAILQVYYGKQFLSIAEVEIPGE